MDDSVRALLKQRFEKHKQNAGGEQPAQPAQRSRRKQAKPVQRKQVNPPGAGQNATEATGEESKQEPSRIQDEFKARDAKRKKEGKRDEKPAKKRKKDVAGQLVVEFKQSMGGGTDIANTVDGQGHFDSRWTAFQQGENSILETAKDFADAPRKTGFFIQPPAHDRTITAFYFRSVGAKKLLHETVQELSESIITESLERLCSSASSRSRRSKNVKLEELAKHSPTLFWNILRLSINVNNPLVASV